MPIKETTINNVVIKPLISAPKKDIDAVKGGKLISTPFQISLLNAKRKSGKTTILANAALQTTTKKTVFWIFSPTATADHTMVEFIRKLRERGNMVTVYPSLMDGKIDLLDVIMTQLLDEVDDTPPVLQPPKPKVQIALDRREFDICVFGKKSSEEKTEVAVEKFKPTKYEPKKKSPEYCFIIDDLATELNKTRGGLAKMLFNGRHIHASVYISFQYKNQLPPGLWSQATYVFLFKNLAKDKLEEIYHCMNLHNLSLKEFFEIYEYATAITDKDHYPFLFCDVEEGKYRRNFNKEIAITNNIDDLVLK